MSALYRPTVSDAIATGGGYMQDRGRFHSPRFHQGIDDPVAVGTAVYASGAGTVKRTGNTGNSSGYGRYVEISYVVGRDVIDVLCAHLSALHVSRGQSVDVLTEVADSGGARGSDGAGASGGPHVHIEVRVNGTLVNPGAYLYSRSTLAGGTILPIPSQNRTTHMYRVYDTAPTGAAYLAGPGALVHILAPSDDAILQRLLSGETAFTLAELKRITYYCDAFEKSGSLAVSDIDVKSLAAELARIDPELTAAEIAARVQAILADDFARIPGAVRAAIIK
ncbi:peptidase M23-like protein [Homoserinimonas aerilata]|uniref:Peptidase M23-like protein n=1 Tax=Homoserinimonas aerilata TaxID=1162970 RepID=A0A542YEZ6_9MICO|nr:M23 family metallopeptidase [Homoserinimonas aerilata]TQL46665.1 peptidase M23-like protein [Homoserinimonas aerilata]